MFKSALTIGIYTAISRVFGLCREICIAHFLGASFVTDAFFIAFKFPNFFRRIFAEGAFNAAFVPSFSQLLVTHGKQEAYAFAERMFSVLATLVLGLVIFVVSLAPVLIHGLAPGFVTTPERFTLTVTFIRLMFPYIFFMSLSAHLAGVLNSLHHFSAAAAAPILLNLIMIFALVVADSFELNYGLSLAYSIPIAGAMQLGFLYVACSRSAGMIRLRWPEFGPDAFRLFRLMGPGVLGAGVMNINLFIDTILASFLPEKSISFLFYADRLNQFPLSILGFAMGTALLPVLSQKIKEKDEENALKTKQKALEIALLLSIPAGVGLMLLSYPLIDLIYGLSFEDTTATAHALSAFALGIPAYVLTKILSTGFFARHDTKTPVKIGCLCIGINLGFNLLFMPVLGHVGLALATSIASWGNAIFLYKTLYRRKWIQISFQEMKPFLQKILLMTTAMGAGMVGLKSLTPSFLYGSFLGKFFTLTALMITGFSIYGIFAIKFGYLSKNFLRSLRN